MRDQDLHRDLFLARLNESERVWFLKRENSNVRKRLAEMSTGDIDFDYEKFVFQKHFKDNPTALLGQRVYFVRPLVKGKSFEVRAGDVVEVKKQLNGMHTVLQNHLLWLELSFHFFKAVNVSSWL